MKQSQPTNSGSEIDIRPWHDFESDYIKNRDEMIRRDFAIKSPSTTTVLLACKYGLSLRRIQEICVKGGLSLKEELTDGSSHHQSSEDHLVSPPEKQPHQALLDGAAPLVSSPEYVVWLLPSPFPWWQHLLCMPFVLPVLAASLAVVAGVVFFCVRAYKLLFV